MSLQDKVKKIAQEVSDFIKKKHQIEDYYDYAGKCIEASEIISERLKKESIPHRIVEGWCLYDDDSTCSDRPYDEHTWVEVETVNNIPIYVDVTARQFEFQIIDAEIPEVIVGDMPYYMKYQEPDPDIYNI